MEKIITIILFTSMLLPLTACGNNTELELLRKENEELRQKLKNQGNDLYSTQSDANLSTEYKAKFTNENKDNVLENENVRVKFLNNIIITSATQNQYDIILNFEYTNKMNEGHNFLYMAPMTLYQNGVELETTWNILDKTIFDSGSSSIKIKDGATIQVQRAFKISNLNSNIDVEISLVNSEKLKRTIEIYK